MTTEITLNCNKLLENLSNELDISESHYKQAEERYIAVRKWLRRKDSIVAKYSPDIYPQGSFSLGTVIKPTTDAEEYDIDIVCELNIRKVQVSQKQLKELVGYEIKGYAHANNMKSPPEEGKRCWILNYSDGAQFHMDILPSLPDSDSFQNYLEKRGLSVRWTELAIAITDNTHETYNKITDDWLSSNPKGYAEWFKERMRIQFESQRKFIAESTRVVIEAIPDYTIKTPLQRAIQILKRHRDLMFPDKRQNNDKPISIIITTLAAHAYNNEDNLLDALVNIVNSMANYIQMRNGEAWIENPTIPTENFAEKWQEHPQRKVNFINWIKQVQIDVASTLQTGNLDDMLEKLKPRSGDHLINRAANKAFPERNAAIKASAIIAPNINISKPIKPWGV